MFIEKFFAGLGLAACVLLLIRLALPFGLRARCDREALRLGRNLWQGAQALPQWWPARRRRAQRAAQDAIRRARDPSATRTRGAKGAPKGRWEGNVYKPDAFGNPDDTDPPPPRRDMH